MTNEKLEVLFTPTKENFYKEGFGIYRGKVKNEKGYDMELGFDECISVKGNMPKLNIGEEYKVVVSFQKNDKYKGNYNLHRIMSSLPTDRKSQELYFKALLTPLQFNALITAYPEEDLISLFKENKLELSKVKGLGETRYEALKKKIISSSEMSDILIASQEYGIPLQVMNKLVAIFSDASLAIDKVKKNPYIMTDLDGMGFVKTDKIALNMGIEKDSEFRIGACIEYVQKEEQISGHTWTLKKNVISKVSAKTTVDKKRVEEVIEKLNDDAESQVKIIGEKLTLERTFENELLVAKSLIDMSKEKKEICEQEKWEKLIDEHCEQNGYNLAKGQKNFLYGVNKEKVALLIGYGGCGKSFVQKILIDVLEKHHLKDTFALLAPTGRASKVLSNYTSKPASTIHRRLPTKFNPMGIDEELIIVDESSMCDIFLVSQLLNCIENGDARILFVGDDFQIPSVGAGNFLYDVIHSGKIPVFKLTEVFRQEEGGIRDISAKVRNGQEFLRNTESGRKVFGRDCVFMFADSQYLLNGIVKKYKGTLDKFKDSDVAILSPTNKGKLGTRNINREIQKLINPPAPNKKEFKIGKDENEITIREGDLVINTKNAYELKTVDGKSVDVFNGDIGRVKEIINGGNVVITFDDIDAVFERENIINLLHGWSISIHKSQGSQFKVIFAVVDKSSTYQLNANLLYTGFSRAEKMMLVLGQSKVINNAMRKFENMERRSFLKDLLKNKGHQEENKVVEKKEKNTKKTYI